MDKESINAAFEPDARKKEEEYIGLLAAIVESSNDAIIGRSLDGTINSWNKGGEKMFGYTASELVGKPISLIIPKDYIEEEKKIFDRICNNETIENYETLRTRKNGEDFHVSLTVSPVKDRSGNIIGISKIARDITSHKKFEVDLLYANKQLADQKEEMKKRAEELVIANKELAFQNGEKEKRAEELVIANAELVFQNKEKEKRAEELVIANAELVFQNNEKGRRASELIIANKELAFQNDEKGKRADELLIANAELVFQNKEKVDRASELIIANKELAFQNDEKGKRADELLIANAELVFQNKEKVNRAEELVIANAELVFQNNEKGRRASELVITNKELAFQNVEKGKRADELIIANAELVIQNKEKVSRASELVVAYKELAFQNDEKGKRADELLIANAELVFQDGEKEKRASELVVANKELAFQNDEKEKRADELLIANAELVFQDAEKEKRKMENTELEALSKSLKQASQYARSLIEASLDPLVTISPEGKITDVNEASVIATGVPKEKLIGTDFSNYFTEPEKARDGYKKGFEKGFVSDYPLVIKHKNGTLTDVLYNASVYKDDKGNVLGVFAAARDVTAQKAERLITANRELVIQNKEKEKRAAELSIANKKLVFQNEEKEKRAAELVVANKELVFQNEEKEKRAAELVVANKELVFQSDEKGKRASELLIANKELIFQNKEKEKRNIYIVQMKVVQEQNRLLTENLTIHNQQLANFAHISSHNLRSPVANLNTLFAMYKEDQSEEDKNDILEKFERVILHLTNTLNDLCESLIISSDINKARELLSFEDILMKTMEILTGQVIETKAEITYDFSKAPHISYPHIYLESIFLNLLSNSIKYRSKERVPQIHFETDHVNGKIKLTAKDNGIGIDLEKHGDKLFGLHKVFHRNKDARGVGLYLTKTHVEAMGGSIMAESEVDKGITFELNF